ncbi:MAG: lipopolysaccharide biosynthesis protein [Bilifractor sp.]|jgi:O-antigen/teichoic acid export membrane protein
MSQRKEVVQNFLWRFAERCGAQGVNFIVAIVLARLLDPSDYGVISMVTIFTNILNVFVDSGLGTALVQKKNADDLDFSTVFFFNFAVCLILYGLMFLAAPFIARFYRMDSLTPLIRVLSLTLVISGIKNIQQAFVSRKMEFRRFFFATLGGTLFSAVLGIWMAYRGAGAWALVAQQLSNAAIDTTILWLTVKWRPRRMFSLERLKSLFSFGWKLLVSSLLDTTYNNLWNLVIGKVYSSEDLAFYNQGQKFPNVIVTNINTSIDSVLLPTMSRVQDDRERVKAMTRRSITVSIYIMAPMMMGLAFLATPIVSLLLSDKWLPCVPFLRIFCITYMFYPIHTANLNAMKAMGRSDLFLKLEILKKAVGIAALLLTVRHGVFLMACSLLVTSFVSQIINAGPNKKLLNYGYLEQLRDILPGILLSVLMGIVTALVGLIPINRIIRIFLQVIAGAAFYIGVSELIRNETYEYLKQMVKNRRNE